MDQHGSTWQGHRPEPCSRHPQTSIKRPVLLAALGTRGVWQKWAVQLAAVADSAIGIVITWHLCVVLMMI